MLFRSQDFSVVVLAKANMISATDKASGSDHFDDGLVFSNNRIHPSNKLRTYPFSKRESGAAWYQKKFACSVWRASSTDSPPSKQQSPVSYTHLDVYKRQHQRMVVHQENADRSFFYSVTVIGIIHLICKGRRTTSSPGAA